MDSFKLVTKFDGKLDYTDAEEKKNSQKVELDGEVEIEKSKDNIYKLTLELETEGKGQIQKALEEINNVKWYPSWGNERMTNMIKDRTDWCISRICGYYCDKCKFWWN